MFGRFRTWLRRVLPAELALLAVVIVTLGPVVYAAVKPWPGASTEAEGLPTWLFVVLYGVFRAVYFNPHENRAYGAWLSQSPWQFPQALPLGPLHLVWQDVFVVGVLMAVFWNDFFTRLSVPTSFLLAYCLTLTYSHSKRGQYWLAYAIAFLCGCFVLVTTNAVARLVAAAAMYPLVYYASQRALQQFSLRSESEIDVSSAIEQSLLTIGLPVAPSRKGGHSWNISHVDALFVACTVGWLFFCIAFHLRHLPEFASGMRRALAWVSAASIIGRILIYTIGYAPPISFLGRLATGRIIIPRYDVVFVAPVSIALTTWLLVEVIDQLGIPVLFAIPTIAGIVVWLSLVLPPKREAWQLTGHHRIAYRFLTALTDRNKSSKSGIYSK